ncbi:YpdA family putative bacillithiol disulfide reductase [Paenibacillus pasadenensis]|uniref:YpdA family putative bacillithiol disulfide reductase n=1 Tax=Paenibacillus pasadenensis TaxID=217090 RepID=UPI00204001A8|nr:YpdA family putative bacillithiol disulfide reductase [Paenibacillus pasadenensis]MCM3748908.1 YpdA family putative bacillithiol disulfide reductase [Paenibacillus pasadenensis]
MEVDRTLQQEQIIIIGAGPCGLAAAIELRSQGVDALIIEKENLVHSISQYPTYLSFFSSPELLEIGGVPFTTAQEKPSRLEALNYYRTVALRSGVRINAYEKVNAVVKAENGFQIESCTSHGEQRQYSCRALVVATGYFDHPNRIGIPGEDLPKVSHFFREAHPYTGMKVAIIGGSNSAIDAALELERVGAEVTVIYRKPDYSPHIKPWVRPVFESLVRKERIRMLFNSRTVAIDQASITIQGPEGEQHELENDFVLALTGFHPDREFLMSLGVAIEQEGYPFFNSETMETNIPGIYLAGVVASRHEANEIFIETGRFHGVRIAEHWLQQQ